jgi:NADPH-dependent 2,4-dienoyl-CoA reductase/sulfur reductase-like enzyme
MSERIVVIGGDAGGMSAASRAKRMRPELDVVVLERGSYTSYSACGIPYWVAGDVDGPDGLVVRTPEEHRANGIDVHMHTEAVALDLGRRVVRARSVDGSGADGREEDVAFDQLVIATGATPIRPDLPGIGTTGVFGVQTLDDGAAVLAWVDGLAERKDCRAVVVGAGYIGIEMAEALFRHGLNVTVVDRAAEPMGTMDPDMGRAVRTAMEGLGIEVVTRAAVERIDATDGRVSAVVADGRSIPADVVVLGLGVRPNTALARDAGIALGAHGGLVTDARMQVAGHDGVWAAGDCVEVLHRVTGDLVHVPLGTHANKQGRVLGINLGGGQATFPGVVGTAISKVCDLEISRTGLTEKEAERAGFAFVTAKIDSTTTAGYFPTAEPMAVKLLAERGTGRLLGVQIVGRQGAAKRIDAAAVAVWNAMTVDDVIGLDLSYAPPFAPVWDPVLVAARKAAAALGREG